MKIRIVYRIRRSIPIIFDTETYPHDVIFVDYMNVCGGPPKSKCTDKQIKEISDFILKIGNKYGRERTS